MAMVRAKCRGIGEWFKREFCIAFNIETPLYYDSVERRQQLELDEFKALTQKRRAGTMSSEDERRSDELFIRMKIRLDLQRRAEIEAEFSTVESDFERRQRIAGDLQYLTGYLERFGLSHKDK